MDYYSVKAHYFDASALVKLVADDADELPGREIVRKYYYEHSSRHSNQFCVAEALSAFKSKFMRKKIDENKYVEYLRSAPGIWGNHIELEEVDLLSPDAMNEAERLIRLNKIDLLDCLQMVALLKGRYRHFCAGS
jgi:hypothetical protein